MNATIPILLVSTVVSAFASRSAAQEPSQPRLNSRRPVDVSVTGLGQATRRAPDHTTRGGTIGFSARRPTESTLPLDCLESIADQATGSCLTASSSPTLGMLFPYPGLNNVFVPPAFVGSGENNQATVSHSTVSGGKNNLAAGYVGSYSVRGYATVAGGENNQATGAWSVVGGGYRNTASGFHSTVGGGRQNTASSYNATVGGGFLNAASSYNATVGGGIGNTASQRHSTVGGGWYNTANDILATVAGGGNNDALSRGATVAGGRFNTAGFYSAVAGGSFNTASGAYASVPGGKTNGALGRFSFAGGRNAKTNHDGAFVWGDSYYNFQKPSLKTSSAPDEFNVYASGGVRMFTNSAATTGVLLAPGGSTWTMVSDRDAKENVEPVDARAILDKVTQLPLATWNYKAQDDSIRHMGPMAQDFYAAFGLGLGDKTIDTIDPNGVALAAIQGLNELVTENEQRLAEKDAEIEELRAANEALRQSDRETRQRIERLEALAQATMAR